MNPLSLLYNRPFLWSVCAGCVIVIGLVGSLLLGEMASVKVERARADANFKVMIAKSTELGQCQSERDQGRAEITGRNTQIQTWRQKAEAAQALADQRAAAARQQAASFRSRAARIAAETAGPDRCAAASDLYVRTLSEERR
jgi:hypothetical protein